MSGGRILFIDAYDSFSNSITRLLEEQLGVSTEKIKIDDARFVLNDDAFERYLQSFDAVVAGPGPGHPESPKDVGLIGKLWSTPDNQTLPVMGICLGFQSLCVAFGAQTRRLTEPRHGLITKITHQSGGIFEDAQDVYATQYHSLHMLLSKEKSQTVTWKPSRSCPDLLPIAWDTSDPRNGPILMAVQHVAKPFVGVQFHPESICTNSEGKQLIRTWWRTACQWNQHRGRSQKLGLSSEPSTNSSHAAQPEAHRKVDYRRLDLRLETLHIAELLRYHSCLSPIVLQSGTNDGQVLNPETGRFSIVGLRDESTTSVEYHISSGTIVTYQDGESILRTGVCDAAAAFAALQTYINQHRASDGASDIPFWGGLVGYVTYESGLQSIGVEPSITSTDRPDMWFYYIERSIVVDHVVGTIYVQSTRPDDISWVEKTAIMLQSAATAYTNGFAPKRANVQLLTQPEACTYRSKVTQCQEHLRAGSSYELCLTAQTTVQTNEDSWSIYRRLSKLNPAPFGAYLSFESSATRPSSGVDVVGSSPERFLSWSRTGRCQFRPIKGTVSKSTGITRVEAETLLRTQKEMAENLMIVDLIRHDLAAVQGVQNVRVPNLMSVEEYETVFQLVSVIEGDLDPCTSGTSVLAASLPPGSMTGAPKKRSCELLKTLEDDLPRGLYSGVIGYLDVGGGGDFSVVIRSAFKWRDEDFWRVGAGGAVTVLSTPEGEYEEMLVKRERVLDVVLHGQDL